MSSKSGGKGNSIAWSNKARAAKLRHDHGKHAADKPSATRRVVSAIKELSAEDKELMRVSPALFFSKQLMHGAPEIAMDSKLAVASLKELVARGHTVREEKKDGKKVLMVYGPKGEKVGIFTTPDKLKRKPLLADEFIASPLLLSARGFSGTNIRVVREHLIEAKKFVLDEKAAIYAAEMIRDYPLAIARDQEFAIPTFPRMYIELPYPAFFKTINGHDTDPDGDTDVGYFIDGPRAYVLSRAETPSLGRNLAPMIMPIRYKLNQPLDIKEELKLCEDFQISRAGLDTFYWGSVTPKVQDDPHIFHALRENHGAEVWYGEEVDLQKMYSYLYKSAAGDLRNILALILFLNRTSQLRIEDEIGFHRSFIYGKPTTLTKHNVVKIKLDPKPMLKRIYGTGSAWRRRHEVRGHFCHDKDARNAPHHPDGHDWHEYGVNKWRCMVCAGQKWWRKACMRGSREKGTVITTYEVTK